MKKILLSTILLTAFSLSILLFQLSCKKSADAQSSSSTSAVQLNKILYQKDLYSGVGNSNKYDSAEIWSANYDGTNQQKINIALPAGYVIVLGPSVKISPDNKTIFFDAFSPGNNYPSTSTPRSIYACNIDGSNVHLIIQGTSTADVETNVAY